MFPTLLCIGMIQIIQGKEISTTLLYFLIISIYFIVQYDDTDSKNN
jgi:hypothetical protein